MASLENNNHIDLCRWAKAQELAELLRKSLHRMYDETNKSVSESAQLDQLIIQEIKKHLEKTGKKEFTISKLLDRQKVLERRGRTVVTARIELWAKHGFLQKETTTPNQRNKKPVEQYRFSNWQEIMHD